MMTDENGDGSMQLDPGDVALVQAAAAIAAGSELQMRAALVRAFPLVDPLEMEEVILQSYLFAGFPRALNAAREWRRVSGRTAPVHDAGEEYGAWQTWQSSGEKTCSVVYGRFYEQLRKNIRSLHPALDAWMIVDGYGKVLSRPALDLKRRELCIVAACAAAKQDRQLHSHLHGALHAGATVSEIRRVLDAMDMLLSSDEIGSAHLLLNRVASSNVH
jgi:4-carboxymuconolactone decarboxylase